MPANMMQERLKAIVNSNKKVIAAPFQILTPHLQTSPMPELSSLQGQLAIEPLLENIE